MSIHDAPNSNHVYLLKPSEACAILFSLRYRRGCRPVSHPISYSTWAARVKNIIVQPEQPDEKNDKSKEKK